MSPFIHAKTGRFSAVTMRRWLASGGALVAILIVLLCPSAWGQTRTYRIDPAASAVRLYVYKAGMLASLAHDHVMLATGLTGQISVDSTDITRSSVEVRVAADQFVVDSPEERTKAGLEGGPGDSDRASIAKTMTGPKVLDAAKWPEIRAASSAVTGSLPDLTAVLNVRIHDQERPVTIPVKVQVTPERLIASGSAELLQSQFGIEPYSTGLGTIAVKDRIVVQFDLVAAPLP